MDLTEMPAEWRDEIQKLIASEVDSRMGEFSKALESMQSKLSSVSDEAKEDRATLVVFSGEMDTLFAACTIASGAAAMGMEVSMYFTFWGLNAIRTGKSE